LRDVNLRETTAFTLGAGLNQVVTVTFSPTVVGWETTTLTDRRRRLRARSGRSFLVGDLASETRFACVSTRGGNADIYVMDADGANPAPLTSLGDADLNPSWSPDGTRIAYYADSGAGVQIRTMGADGSNNVVASSFGTLDLDPDGSPFGGAAPTVSLSITSPIANQMLPLGATSHDLSVDIVGHSSPGH
jgi:hypothetical protein